MSWDIVLFNSRQIINSVEEIDEEQLVPTDFCSVLESRFENIQRSDNYRRIKEDNYEIEYFTDTEDVSNKILNLFGEQGLFEIVLLARQNNWQIYDTGLGQMLDLKNPDINGYENFKNYVEQILNNR